VKRKKSKSEKVVQSVEIPGFGLPATETPVESEKQMDLVTGTFVHVDEYIEDKAQPECLRVFLDRARMPGHGMHEKTPYPKLFATYIGEDWRGYTKGDRVRVTMASRMGDVGVTKNMSQDFGYEIRCPVDYLTDFSAEA
jgi:hypothetical protein